MDHGGQCVVCYAHKLALRCNAACCNQFVYLKQQRDRFMHQVEASRVGEGLDLKITVRPMELLLLFKSASLALWRETIQLWRHDSLFTCCICMRASETHVHNLAIGTIFSVCVIYPLAKRPCRSSPKRQQWRRQRWWPSRSFCSNLSCPLASVTMSDNNLNSKQLKRTH